VSMDGDAGSHVDAAPLEGLHHDVSDIGVAPGRIAGIASSRVT